jgi:NAD(P)H-dependent flavin oxidoreductase YrpB (nitropropane dioxygenase family)
LIKGEESARPGFTRQVMEDAWIKGNLEAGLLPAGQVAGLVSDAPSVREVINEIIR